MKFAKLGLIKVCVINPLVQKLKHYLPRLYSQGLKRILNNRYTHE